MPRKHLIGNKHGMTHGGTYTPEFRIWTSMIQRCTNKNLASFANYGGRGISVCERWSSFECFLVDMGKRPSPTHQIDRIDVNGHYEPGNCRWVTPKQQSRNRRSNRLLTHMGETMCLAAWAERLGIRMEALHARLTRWDVAKALTTPDCWVKRKE